MKQKVEVLAISWSMIGQMKAGNVWLFASSGGTIEAMSEQKDRLRELIFEHGWNATVFQILNPGMRYWFSAAGDAVIAYVSRGNICVVAGAPLCAAERLEGVVREFEAQHGEIVYFGAESRLKNVLGRSKTHSCVSIGGQPVLEAETWSETLRKKASLRAQLNRAKNKGVSVRETDGGSAIRGDLERCLAQWLASRRCAEMHFLVETDVFSELAARRLFVAERGGEVVAFLVAAPIPRRNGWLIEHLIRGEKAVNGVTELMLDCAIRAFGREGFTHISLGLVPLSHLDRETRFEVRALYRFMRWFGSWAYNFNGLEQFKTKLQPAYWESVEAIANSPRFSARHFYAVGGAFASESPIVFVLRSWIPRFRFSFVGEFMESIRSKGERR